MQIQPFQLYPLRVSQNHFAPAISRFSASLPTETPEPKTKAPWYQRTLFLAPATLGTALFLAHSLGILRHQPKTETWLLQTPGQEAQVVQPGFRFKMPGTRISAYPAKDRAFNTTNSLIVLSQDKKPIPFGYNLDFKIEDPCKLERFVSKMREDIQQIKSDAATNYQLSDQLVQSVVRLYIQDKLSQMTLQEFQQQSTRTQAQDILATHPLSNPQTLIELLGTDLEPDLQAANTPLTLNAVLSNVLGITPCGISNCLNDEERIRMVKRYLYDHENQKTLKPYTRAEIKENLALWQSSHSSKRSNTQDD